MLTTRQAAQRLGLSREMLLRRVERGEIAGRFEAGRWLIDPQSVAEYTTRSRGDGANGSHLPEVVPPTNGERRPAGAASAGGNGAENTAPST